MTNSNEEELKSEFDHHHPCHRHGFRKRLWAIPFAVAAIVVVKSALVLVLWNHLIPDLFNGPLLTFPQAIGLTVLAKLLVGFGGHRHFGGPPWAHKMKARWAALSPEERDKLRHAIRHRHHPRD